MMRANGGRRQSKLRGESMRASNRHRQQVALNYRARRWPIVPSWPSFSCCSGKPTTASSCLQDAVVFPDAPGSEGRWEALGSGISVKGGGYLSLSLCSSRPKDCVLPSPFFVVDRLRRATTELLPLRSWVQVPGVSCRGCLTSLAMPTALLLLKEAPRPLCRWWGRHLPDTESRCLGASIVVVSLSRHARPWSQRSGGVLSSVFSPIHLTASSRQALAAAACFQRQT